MNFCFMQNQTFMSKIIKKIYEIFVWLNFGSKFVANNLDEIKFPYNFYIWLNLQYIK